jgi:hypothetical protein
MIKLVDPSSSEAGRGGFAAIADPREHGRNSRENGILHSLVDTFWTKKSHPADGFLSNWFLMPGGNGAFTRWEGIAIAIQCVPGKNGLARIFILTSWSSGGLFARGSFPCFIQRGTFFGSGPV